MSTDLVAAIRQRVSAFDVVKWVIALAVVYVLVNDLWLLLGIGVAVLLTDTLEFFADVPSVDERWLKAGLGTLLTLASVGWVLFEARQSTVTPALVLPTLGSLVGLWVLLDTRVDFVQGRRFGESDEFDDIDTEEAMLVMQHLRIIANELEDEPKSVSELASACDLTESRVREAIALVERDGTIYRVESETEDGQPQYTLDEQKVGLGGLGRQAAGGIRGLGRRLARPLVDQFE